MAETKPYPCADPAANGEEGGKDGLKIDPQGLRKGADPIGEKRSPLVPQAEAA